MPVRLRESPVPLSRQVSASRGLYQPVQTCGSARTLAVQGDARPRQQVPSSAGRCGQPSRSRPGRRRNDSQPCLPDAGLDEWPGLQTRAPRWNHQRRGGTAPAVVAGAISRRPPARLRSPHDQDGHRRLVAAPSRAARGVRPVDRGARRPRLLARRHQRRRRLARGGHPGTRARGSTPGPRRPPHRAGTRLASRAPVLPHPGAAPGRHVKRGTRRGMPEGIHAHDLPRR